MDYKSIEEIPWLQIQKRE